MVSSEDPRCCHSCAGDASGSHAPPLTHLRANVGYAWSSLRAARPKLAGTAGPVAGVALLLAVRLIGLQVWGTVLHPRCRSSKHSAERCLCVVQMSTTPHAGQCGYYGSCRAALHVLTRAKQAIRP